MRGKRVSGEVGRGRALTRSPALLCCKTRQPTTRSIATNPYLLDLLSHELLEFLGHYGSLSSRKRRPFAR